MKTLSILLFTVCLAVAEEKPPCCREVEASAPLADKSLYQLESKWTSDFGKEIQLGVLRGRPQIVAMFFTSCEYACPIIVENMKSIEQALPPSLRDKVDFLLVTLDVEHDTVEVLNAFRAKAKLATTRWTLLRGKDDDVRELAALLGINYQRDARGQFSHSNLISVLDSGGELAFQQAGLNKDPEEIATAIGKILSVDPP